MNPTPEPEAGIAEVAARLTKAQRAALLAAEEIIAGELNVQCSANVEYELALIGLVNDLDGDALTPLGLAVRQHLARSQGED